MTPTFEKLKKSYFKLALIKTLAVAVAGILFTVGGIVLGTKLAKVDFGILYSVLIGIGVGLVAGGIAFLLLHKKAKALAKRLDEEYGLHEKVQTMLEYQEGKTDMLLLQRENAETQLKAKTGGKTKTGRIWINAVSLGLALGLFLTGVFLPVAGRSDTANAEEKYAFSNWQYNSMQELIAYVDDSPMHVNLKPIAKAELQALLDDVCDYDETTGEVTTDLTKTETILKVNDSIVYLDETVEEYNTYKKLYNTLTETNSELVVDYANTLRALQVGEPLADLRDKMVDGEEDASNVVVLVESFADEIIASFAMAEVPTTDELFIASNDFMTAVKQGANKQVADTTQQYKAQQVALDSAFELKKGAVDSALVQQDENRGSFDYIIAELIKIFEISNPPETGGESLAPISVTESDSGVDEPGGAAGEGGIIFGSDEKVYYPDEQTQVKYGDIFIDYDAKKDEVLKEQNLTDEKLKEIIDKYVDKLYGASGLEKDDAGN